jgi:hypothetical protein
MQDSSHARPPRARRPRQYSSRFKSQASLLLLATFALCSNALACATCGCTLSTDAAMGYSADPGWRINLEYDFINQNQLRSGADAISPNAAAMQNNVGGDQEIEHQTINRYTTLGISYSPSADWNFNLMVPFVDRSHSTYGAATSDEINQANLSAATSDGLGDVKFLIDYQGLLPTHNWGLQFGVKLPTGHYGGENANGALVGRDPVLFSSGPAVGSALDTSLNPGTGSTDLIVGSYYYQPVSQNFDAFINGQFQAAVSEKLDQPGQDFRPGNVTTVSFGLRYEENPDLVPQLQINMTHKSPDQGALADTIDTAGNVVYVSPGATVAVYKGLYAYGFVQLPVYERLQRYQVFPRWTASVGLSYAF